MLIPSAGRTRQFGATVFNLIFYSLDPAEKETKNMKKREKFEKWWSNESHIVAYIFAY